MDGQLSTWMDWIWSSWCLALFCTSTESCNLKWASGGGINSPRHQTSRWLKADESSTVGWSDAMFFRVSVHPVLLALPPLHMTVDTTAQLHMTVESSTVGWSEAWIFTTSLCQASQDPDLKAFKWPSEPKSFEAPSCWWWLPWAPKWVGSNPDPHSFSQPCVQPPCH
jgi:hypothetical protein